MKLIPLAQHGPLHARTVLIDLLKTAPAGQTLGDMRARLKVLKKLETAKDSVTLEDAEHQTLVAMLNSRSDFVVTSEDIISIVDAVFDAKEPKTK